MRTASCLKIWTSCLNMDTWEVRGYHVVTGRTILVEWGEIPRPICGFDPFASLVCWRKFDSLGTTWLLYLNVCSSHSFHHKVRLLMKVMRIASWLNMSTWEVRGYHVVPAKTRLFKWGEILEYVDLRSKLGDIRLYQPWQNYIIRRRRNYKTNIGSPHSLSESYESRLCISQVGSQTSSSCSFVFWSSRMKSDAIYCSIIFVERLYPSFHSTQDFWRWHENGAGFQPFFG